MAQHMTQSATIDPYVQAELFRRAALLGVRPGRAALAAEIDMIRRIARQNGMIPASPRYSNQRWRGATWVR